MKTLRAIKDHIIFKFCDEITTKSDTGRERRQFTEHTNWDFEISSYDESAKQPRWGYVQTVGPDVSTEIKHGTKVLIESLKWTEAIEFNGETIWRTVDSCVLAIDDDYISK